MSDIDELKQRVAELELKARIAELELRIAELERDLKALTEPHYTVTYMGEPMSAKDAILGKFEAMVADAKAWQRA
jgi:uncharacterized coiled-coil protein SlyX